MTITSHVRTDEVFPDHLASDPRYDPERDRTPKIRDEETITAIHLYIHLQYLRNIANHLSRILPEERKTREIRIEIRIRLSTAMSIYLPSWWNW